MLFLCTKQMEKAVLLNVYTTELAQIAILKISQTTSPTWHPPPYPSGNVLTLTRAQWNANVATLI